MRKMEQVTRYRCGWCGKEFRTPDRHECRWDPDAHNCLSCKHRGGRAHEVLGAGYDDWWAFECPFFDDPCEAPCDFAKGAVDACGNGCPHWELQDGYKGKKSFAKMEADREGKPEYKDQAELRQAAGLPNGDEPTTLGWDVPF